MKISKNNIIFIILIILTYILFSCVIGYKGIELIKMTITQLVLIAVAISPIGELVLRLIYGVRIIKTNKDKERLLPLFEEVYESIKNKENYKNNHIKLYIDKSMNVNAYACRNTELLQ